jgi:hypothetical protein
MPEDPFSHLSDLVGLGLVPPWLECQDLGDSWTGENVVASPDVLAETEVDEQGPQVLEPEGRVVATEYQPLQSPLASSHPIE